MLPLNGLTNKCSVQNAGNGTSGLIRFQIFYGGESLQILVVLCTSSEKPPPPLTDQAISTPSLSNARLSDMSRGSAIFHWVNHESLCTRLIYAQKSIIITQHSNYDKYCLVHSGKPSGDYIHYVLAKVCQK